MSTAYRVYSRKGNRGPWVFRAALDSREAAAACIARLRERERGVSFRISPV